MSLTEEEARWMDRYERGDNRQSTFNAYTMYGVLMRIRFPDDTKDADLKEARAAPDAD